MSTYCRITGKSRGLPKPHYFPLLPPISPADARRICRITGKSYGLPTHHFIPVLSAVSRARSKPCHITSKSEGHESHHYAPASVKHVVQKGFRYLAPLLEANAELMTILEGKPLDENNRRFIYTVDENKCTLVLPGRVESAIRDGDIKDIMLSKDSDKILVKLRKGATIELDVKDYSKVDSAELFEGEGPSKEAILKRKKRKTNDNTDWRRKVFEDKEKQALNEEMRLSEIKSKRIKVKLEAWKENPVFSSWKNVRAEPSTTSQNDDRFNVQFKNVLQRLDGDRNLSDLLNAAGKPFVNTLPQPTKIESQIVDLSHSLPGIIQQPIVVGDSVTGFPVAKIVSPFQPFVQEIDPSIVNVLKDFNANKPSLQNVLQKQNVIQQKQATSLPTLENVSDLVKGLRKLFEKGTKNGKNNKFEQGLKITIGDVEKYVPGQFVKTDQGETFVPGNVVETSTGPTFVPGLVLRTDSGTKFLPGFIFEDEGHSPTFVAGQNALTRHGEKFVQGQVLQTNDGARFMPGQTVVTADGVRFVPGQIISDQKCKDGHRFVPGQIVMTPEGPQFVTGYFNQHPSTGEVSFVAGQSILNENCNWEFIPGQNMKMGDGGFVFVAGREIIDDEGQSRFVPGQVIIEEGDVERFVPGITASDDSGNIHFVPGMEVETDNGLKFVEGVITAADDGSLAFAAGKVITNEDTIGFECARGVDDLIFHDVHSGVTLNPAAVSSAEGTEVFGHLVQSAQGVEFFPGDAAGLPAGKVIPGRLVKGKEMRFIPGTMIEGKFTPGQFVTTDTEEKFIPGQVIETNEGPKFVPGQVLQTRTGPKFVPGQTMETENGPKFIPGQIIETKRGPTFIPGQVIFTDEEGSRFVPGQVVDTVEGPRFVPGRVVETGDHVTFIPGQIVETEEGLKFIAPDLEDDPEGGYQFTVQGFEVAPEEVKMIGNSIPHACFIGEMAVDAKTLQQLAEAGMAVGRQLPVDIPSVKIRSLPVTETACRIAHNLDIDAAQSVKMSHILSALQQVKQAGVALTPKEIGDDGLEALVYLALESEHDKESYEFLQMLGDALEDTIKIDENKIAGIDTLHKLSTNLAGKVREKLALINSVANHLGVKLNMDSAYMQGKVGQILSNLEQIKKSNVFIPRKEIKDKNLKMLLNLVGDCDTELADPDLLKNLASALENTIQVDPNHSLETIETLCNLTDDLAGRARTKALASIGMAHAVTQNLDLDAANAVKVNHILNNLREIKKSNMALAKEELGDENVQILLNLVQMCEGSSEDEIAQAVASALENTVKLSMDHKLDAIDKLHTLTANVAKKANKKSVLVTNAVKDMAKKFNVSDENATKLDKIVCGLMKMKHSNEIIHISEMKNDAMKALIGLVQDNKELSDKEFLDVLENQFENIANLNNIDLLETSTAEVIAQVENKTKLKSEAALSMASELEMSPEYVIKMMDVLSNLNKIKKAGVAINSDEVNNDNLEILLNLATNSDVNKSDALTIEELSNALKNTLKIDPQQKLQTIDQLHSLTADLACKAESKAETINEIAFNLAKKIDIDKPQAAKIAQILSNLEQIKISNPNLEISGIEDENLRILLKAMTIDADKSGSEQLLKTASTTLEGILSDGLGNEIETINNLEAMTHTLVNMSQDQSKKITKSACTIAENLNVSAPQLIQIGRILANLQQIKESNAPIPKESIKDENLELLLNLAMVCNEKPNDPTALEALTKVLEKTIKLDEDKKIGTLSILDELTSNVASEALTTSRLIKQSANEIAINLNVGEAQSGQLRQILSNLQQICLSNIEIEENDIENKELQTLLSIAMQGNIAPENNKFAATVGASLEEMIKQNPECMLETIDKLQKKSAKLVSEVREKSKLTTATACDIANNLNLGTPHLVQLNHILLDLQEIQKSDIAIPSKAIKNENLELILNLASACKGAKNDEEMMNTLAGVLQTVIQIQPEHKVDTIEILHGLTADVTKATKAKSKSIKQAVAQIAKKFKLEPQSSKLIEILSNAQNIKTSNLNILKNIANTDENVDEFLNTIMKSGISEADDLKFSKVVASALEKYIQNGIENESLNIDTLHSVMTDLNNKVQNQSLLTAETALGMANSMNLKCPQAVQVSHILSNLQKVQQNNFMVSEKDVTSENLKMLINLALGSDEKIIDSDIVQMLGSALQKTIGNSNATSTIDTISELHDQIPSLAIKVRDRMNIFDEMALGIAKKFQLEKPYAVKLCQILANLKEMQISKMDIPALQIKDQNLKLLIQVAFQSDLENDDTKYLQVVGNVLEDSLKNDLDHVLENIDLIHTFTCEVISSKRKQTLLNAETAYNISNKLNLHNSQMVKVNDIITKVQKIQKAGLTLTTDHPENMTLLLDLSVACKDKDKFEAVNTLADALLKTIDLDPKNEVDVVNQLDKLTTDLTEEVLKKVVARKKIAEVVKDCLNLNEEQSMKVEEILSSLQQIKLSNISTSKEIIKNENIGQILKHCLKCDIKKGDIPFLEAVGSFLQQNVTPDKLNELHKVTKELASKGKDYTLQTALTACSIANDLNMKTPELVKMGKIISNLHRIKNANIVSPESKIANDDLEILLNLSLTGEKCNSLEAIKSLATALQKTLNINLEDSISTIVDLNQLVKETAMIAEEKIKVLDDISDQVADKLDVDRIHSAVISDIISNLQQIKLGNIDKAEIEKIEDGVAKKLIKEALQFNILDGDQTHLNNIAKVLENMNILDTDTKFQMLGTLHNVTNILVSQVREKSKLTTEMAMDLSNRLNLTGSKPIVQVSHILTNLQQVKQSNFVVPNNANTQNENVELLINLALTCNDQEDVPGAAMKMVEALQKTLKLNPETILHTLEILNNATNDIASKIGEEDELIHQIGCQMAENLNVPESHSEKLSQILSNLQRLRLSKVPVDIMFNVEDTTLRSLLEATIKISPNIAQENFRTLAKEALENIIGFNHETKLQIISTLHTLTNDLVSKVNKTVSMTTEMAYDIADKINASSPQLLKMSHILSNLQQLKKVDFVPESHSADENLELVMNLALLSKDEKNGPTVLKNLAKALERTVQTENGESSINTLHKLTTELALQAEENSKILDDTTAKIVETCTLDKAHTKRLKEILIDVQRIKHSKIDLQKENINDEELRGVLTNILHASMESDIYQDSVQAVSTVLEKFLLSSDHKKQDIDSIHAIMNNIADNARERTLLMTETAYTVGQELHMNIPQVVKVSHILSNLCDIKQSSIANPISTFEDDNLDLLLTLSLPCDATKPDEQTVKSLASILENTINIDPEQKGKIVENLHTLTADLAQSTKIKSKLVEEKAIKMAQNLNVGDAYSKKLCSILSNLQQIKSAKYDIGQDKIKNENWKALIHSTLQMADNLEDEKFYELLGNEVEKVIRVDPEHKLQNINSLHAVLNGIITKENNRMYLIANTAYKMAKDLKVNTPNLMKLGHILSDLQELNQANVAISQDDIKDDRMQVLLNLSLAGDMKKSDVETIENLSKALLNTIQGNGRETGLIIDTLHAHTAEISSKAQEKVVEVEKIACKLTTKLGMDVSKAAKLGLILSDLEQLARSSLDIEKEDIKNTEIRKLIKSVMQNGDQTNIEFLAAVVENFLKEDLEHQFHNLDELHRCVSDLNAKTKNKLMLLTDNALQVASHLDLGIEGTIKMVKILSNVQQIKEADVALPSTGIESNSLKLLLDLAQKGDTQTCDSDYVEKLRTVLESTVKMNMDHKEQIVEELFALTADAAGKVAQKAQVFREYGLDLGNKLNVDQETALKLTSLLSNLQYIAQTNFNVEKTIDNKDLKLLLRLSNECAKESDGNFVKIVGNSLKKMLENNIDHRLENINSLHKIVTELAATLRQNTSQAANTSQAVATNLKLDAFEAVQMSNVLLNLQHVCQMNVPLAINDIQNEDIKLIVNLALSSKTDSDNPSELVPTLGKALEKLMELRPEIKSETIKLLNCTAANLAKEADQVSTLINNATAKLAENFKIDQSSTQKLNSIFTGLLSIWQADLKVPQEFVEQGHLKELLNVIEEIENDLGNEKLIQKIGDTLENILKFNIEHGDQMINALEASIADITKNVENKTVSQANIACQMANRLDINESCAININEVLTDLKQLKQMQAYVSNMDIEDKNLKLIFNHILACENDTENTALLQTLANAMEHTVKAGKNDKSENINKLQSMTAQLVSVAQSRSALIEKTASKLAAKLKVDPKKLSKILSNLQQIRRSSVFTSMEDIPDKNVHILLNFALENDDVDDVKFFKAAGDILEKIIKANIQQKLQIVDSLCMITTDLATGTWDRALTIAETAHNVANSINADASSINVSHILSNLQQIKLTNIPISGEAVQDEDLKLLLNLASAYDGDVDSSDFVRTLGQALKNTLNLKPDQAIETLAKFHKLTDDLSTKIGNQSNSVKEIANKVANNLKVENSTISDIILNVKEIQLYNLASVDNIENEDLRYLLNLASECGYDYEDVEFLQMLGDAIENIIEIDLDHKSQKIDTLHALSTELASAGRQKALLITSMACKMVDKLNLDPSHSVTISRILTNLQEISESGFIIPSGDVKDKNLELLLNHIRNADANKEECAFLSELGQKLEKLIVADPKRKLEIIHTLQTLSSDIVTAIRRKPPSKVQLLRSLIKNNLELKDDIVEKLSSILDTNEMAMCVAFRNMSRENPDFVGKVLRNAATILNDKRIDEKKAVETLHRAIVRAVGETSEHEVTRVLRRNEGEDIRSLVVDASGLAKALGMNEVVHVLDVILSDSRSMPMLAKDKIVMEVLKRLTVMRQLAEKQPTLRAALHDLQYDPYAARNDPRLRALVRDSAVLMVIPEESLVLRSSADIPCSLLFGDNTLAVEDFMVKSRQTGKTFLILKKGVQMVVPREAARDVLTGKVPYTVLDENGIHHFTPLHVFNALKLPRIATNRFSNYGYEAKMSQRSKAKGDASEKELLFSRCGSVNGVDDSHKTFPNGSCSTQEVMNE